MSTTAGFLLVAPRRDRPFATSREASDTPRARLDCCRVLYVGGRHASVPLYRALVERLGGHFLHHDGGAEHSAALLDASLGAADLVLCHSAMLRHDACWRVRLHCWRTGIRCLFVESASATSLQRVLDVLPEAVTAIDTGYR